MNNQPESREILLEITQKAMKMPDAERKSFIKHWWASLDENERVAYRAEISEMVEVLVEAFKPIRKGLIQAVNQISVAFDNFSAENPAFVKHLQALGRGLQSN